MADDGGIGRLQARLEAIPKRIRENVIPAVTKAAEDMASTMRLLVPVDTGELRDSIAVTPGDKSTPPFSQPGGSMVVPELSAAVTVGNEDVRYGHLVEYGHKGGFGGKGVPAHAFFWPSVRLHRKKATARIKRAVSKAVKDSKK